VIEHPDACSRQISGLYPSGEPLLAVLTKRTYIVDGERAVPAEEQLPLVADPEPDPELPDLLAHDTDLFPYKPATDVVIQGHVYGAQQLRFVASVRVGAYTKQILVIGDRQCHLRQNGTIAISEPAHVDAIPLRYTHAYGGRDSIAEARYGNVIAQVMSDTVPPGSADLDLASPYVYPRNSCGRGYLIEPDPEAVDALVLPNLEDPDDVLSAHRLPVRDPLRWPAMPMPQATDWLGYGWFPRIAYFGMTPPYRNADVVPEIARGFAPDNLLDETQEDTDKAFRATQGASLGLQLPHMRGGESVRLERMHQHHEIWTFQLPDERPRMWTDGREGRLNETTPVIHTVLIEPDQDRLSIVWRGAARARRPYTDDELKEMPFRVAW